jgi:beta-glucosidase
MNGGRHFESYSEDPLLSGNIAAAYINGLQSQGVGATVKHFAVNESEWQRRRININVSEKALREIYYLPFQIAIRDARPWCVMTSYVLLRTLSNLTDTAKSMEYMLLRIMMYLKY